MMDLHPIARACSTPLQVNFGTAALLVISFTLSLAVAGCWSSSSTSDTGIAGIEIPDTDVNIQESVIGGMSESEVLGYVNEIDRILQWPGAPTVRVEASANDVQKGIVIEAVDILNDWLPPSRRMVVGNDVETDVPIAAIRRGRQLVIDSALFEASARTLSLGEIRVSFRLPQTGNVVGLASAPQDTAFRSLVAVIPDETVHSLSNTLVHELMHSLGFAGHVTHPDSLFTATSSVERTFPRIDGEAIAFVYNQQIPPGGMNGNSFTGLGDWRDSIPAISGSASLGEQESLSFGVEYRSDFVRAWDSGPVPDRQPPTGNLVWNGKMVGFEEDGDGVKGAARLTVSPGFTGGEALFNDILYLSNGTAWAGRQALSTTFDVLETGQIRGTGGDSWTGFDGMFRGKNHEGVTGVFSWEEAGTGDLTGAFGVVRN